MFGLIVRIVVLAALVFGVACGISRALKNRAQSAEHKRILAKIEELRRGLEAGLYTQDEYSKLRAELDAECREAGIDVPALPERIRPREEDS
ncbi:MAG: hypothetical protein OXT09_11245 [Myxococcales bacterium]|nr:hypothetical protein [Myxococcales bacterium]